MLQLARMSSSSSSLVVLRLSPLLFALWLFLATSVTSWRVCRLGGLGLVFVGLCLHHSLNEFALRCVRLIVCFLVARWHLVSWLCVLFVRLCRAIIRLCLHPRRGWLALIIYNNASPGHRRPACVCRALVSLCLHASSPRRLACAACASLSASEPCVSTSHQCLALCLFILLLYHAMHWVSRRYLSSSSCRAATVCTSCLTAPRLYFGSPGSCGIRLPVAALPLRVPSPGCGSSVSLPCAMCTVCVSSSLCTLAVRLERLALCVLYLS